MNSKLDAIYLFGPVCTLIQIVLYTPATGVGSPVAISGCDQLISNSNTSSITSSTSSTISSSNSIQCSTTCSTPTTMPASTVATGQVTTDKYLSPFLFHFYMHNNTKVLTTNYGIFYNFCIENIYKIFF